MTRSNESRVTQRKTSTSKRDGTMTSTFATQIQTGTSVYGSDNEKIGEVAGVTDNHFVIEKGFIFTTDLFVPMSAVIGVDEDGIRLSMTKDQVENEDWSNAPETDGAPSHDSDDVYGANGMSNRGDDMLERREEHLAVDKHTEQSGSVHVGKTSVTDTEHVEDTVRREEFDIDTSGTTTRDDR